MRNSLCCAHEALRLAVTSQLDLLYRLNFDLIYFPSIPPSQAIVQIPWRHTHLDSEYRSRRNHSNSAPTSLDEICDSSPWNILHYYPACAQSRPPFLFIPWLHPQANPGDKILPHFQSPHLQSHQIDEDHFPCFLATRIQ